jgi:hypothetical protein
MYQIPGFVTPSSDNSCDRITASSDGQVIFDIVTLPAASAVPAYKVIISQDFGGHKVMFFEDDNQIGIFSELDTSGNYKHIYFYSAPVNLELAPGSYAVEAILNGTVVAFSWLSVPAHLHKNAMSTYAT